MLADRRIAVAGTHGKTTTTAMLTFALRGAGADPSFAIGAEVAGLGTNARRGAGPEFVVEADESDGAFLHYRPHAAVVTNVDADHLDTWGTVEAYERPSTSSSARCRRSSSLSRRRSRLPRAARHGRPPATRHGGLRRRRRPAGHGRRGRGLHHDASPSPPRGLAPTEVVLAVPGRTTPPTRCWRSAIGLQLGHDVAGLVAGLAGYTGAARRMQPHGEAAGVRVVDSYAHHPTEIAADLAAARALAGDDRLVVAYQPHLVSRTRLYGAQMGEALAGGRPRRGRRHLPRARGRRSRRDLGARRRRVAGPRRRRRGTGRRTSPTLLLPLATARRPPADPRRGRHHDGRARRCSSCCGTPAMSDGSPRSSA